MSDPSTSALLREAISHLENPLRWVGHRKLARRIRHHLDDLVDTTKRSHLATLARYLAAPIANLSIDPDEAATRRTAEGIEVRAWFLVPFTALPTDDPDRLARMRQLLEELPALTIEVFRLSRVKGLNFAEIAGRLNISERRVRRHMLRAISHIGARH